MKVRKKIVTEKILKEIVRRIVAAVQPEKSFFSAQRRGKRWGRTATWTCWS